MALTKCIDCGHRVSDLAFACPECARPTGVVAAGVAEAVGASSGGGGRVAVLRTLGTADSRGPTKAKEIAEAPLPAEAVRELREQLRQAQRAATENRVEKRCERCKVDVAQDMFRVRTDG